MSENILKELCNKVLSLFKQTESKEENAKDVACNRLRVVLMQDRTNLTPELLQRMRKELVELLSKYVEMDKDALELNFDQEGDQMALMLSIPVIRAKDEAEIEKALAKEEEEENVENEIEITEGNDENEPSDEEIGEREEANEADNDDEDEEIEITEDSEDTESSEDTEEK
ncbi:MAG: cell division topological specificity factor MinE [Cyanobacteria bacterium SIG26]|nr:cell division topological specificity factor MinE [Cyanobacteria bacterium SIG26]